jgi:hypothetical protein
MRLLNPSPFTTFFQSLDKFSQLLSDDSAGSLSSGLNSGRKVFLEELKLRLVEFFIDALIRFELG